MDILKDKTVSEPVVARIETSRFRTLYFSGRRGSAGGNAAPATGGRCPGTVHEFPPFPGGQPHLIFNVLLRVAIF